MIDLKERFRSLFEERPDEIGRYMDRDHLRFNLGGIEWVVSEIARKKGVSFSVYPATVKGVNALIESGNRCAGLIQQAGPHFAPIYVEKHLSGKYSIVFSDSIGTVDVRAFLSCCPEKMKLGRIFTTCVSRQSDYNSCAIFVIRDFAKYMGYMSQGKSVIMEMDAIRSHRILFYESYDVWDIERLPEPMMRVAQSIEDIEAYGEPVKHYRVAEGGKIINGLIEKHKIKYMKQLLANFRV